MVIVIVIVILVTVIYGSKVLVLVMVIVWRAPRTTMVDPKVSPKDWHSTNQFLDMPRACPP